MQRVRSFVQKRPEALLAVFCACLVVWNVPRLDEWSAAGFEVYLSHAIMQTTLFDFAWVLLIVAVFVDDDARKVGVRWWWILPTFPFMPTLGLLLYFVVRKRALAQPRATAPSTP